MAKLPARKIAAPALAPVEIEPEPVAVEIDEPPAVLVAEPPTEWIAPELEPDDERHRGI